MTKYLGAAIIAIALASTVTGQTTRKSPALESLVAAERAFARTSVEKGIRESFLTFFAEDGINFQPHPVKTREAILKRPAPAARPPIELNWQPAYADVSRAGDLGYTTGPYTLVDQSPEKRPTQYGIYFSIWKKQSDGAWRVVVDAGIETPDASSNAIEFKQAPSSRFTRAFSTSALDYNRASLMKLDREFLEASNSNGLLKAFLDRSATDARLHRNGRFPLVGRAAIKSFLSEDQMTLTWEPMKSDVSASSDLGYTYGSYQLKYSEKSEKGYYVRVWKRNRGGDWKLALDTLSPIPPESK